jgi:LAO/AO transport system kinase
LNTSRLPLQEYENGILKGDRVILSQAITLVESTLASDQKLADEVLDKIMPFTGNALRIGITGSPGVGKSTFIESLGKVITAQGKKMAVLTIDPTSQITRGSILGDKTRMEALAKNPAAFIRPTPSGLTLGGTASNTRETILLCEAACFDVIVIETVGVGQSEFAVKTMVDFFLLLMLPGSGDELQGIKKGIVEMADLIAITKADGENIQRANEARSDFQHALHLLTPDTSGWVPKVLTCSAVSHQGIEEIWNVINQFRQQRTESGHFQVTRNRQQVQWFRERFNHLLAIDSNQFQTVVHESQTLEGLIQSQEISPRKAAAQLLKTYHEALRKNK